MTALPLSHYKAYPMDFQTAILNALLRIHRHSTDTESDEARRARMTVIAVSINDATKRAACALEYQTPECKPIFSDRRLMAGLLIGKGKFESGFAEYVHAGHCLAGPVGAQCDKNREGLVQAHSPWQLWKIAVYPRTDWDKIEGTSEEATSLAAWHATKRLAGSSSLCKSKFGGDNIQGAIAGFAGSCILMDPKKVAYQAETVRRILNTLPEAD